MHTSAVGLSGQRPAASLLRPLRELLTSSQFLDAAKLFAIGVAVSCSRSIAEAILRSARRLVLSHAVIRGRDDAHRWVMHYLTQHPSIKSRPRDVEVSARPRLALSGHDGDEAPNEAGQGGDELAGIFFFPAENESLHFKFKGHHVWASRARTLVGDTEWDETLSLSFLTLSSGPLKAFIAECRRQYNEYERGKCQIFSLDRYGRWETSKGISKRGADSVLLPRGLKEGLLDDARRFLSAETRRWYADRGIPYRRGLLLYGIPGSGKSSMVHVIASELGLAIYTVSLSARGVDDASFLELMGAVPPRSIVLLEDVDAAFVERSGGSGKPPISFSTLLNAIDGVGAAESRILVLTTNHRERLDEALIRPGRIDVQLEFKHATHSQAYDLFVRWFPSPSPSRSAAGEKQSDGVDARAERFASAVPEQTFSVAALQGFLLSCAMDGEAAVQGIDGWVRESLKERQEASVKADAARVKGAKQAEEARETL